MLRLHTLQTGFVLVLVACGGNVDNDASRAALGSSGGQGTSSLPGVGAQSNGGSANTLAGGIRCIAQTDMDLIRDAACAGWTSEPDPSPYLLEFVIDTSGSMGDLVPNSGLRSKWEVTRDALLTAIGSMPSYTVVGLLAYPNQATIPNSGGTHPLDDCLNTAAAVPLRPLGVSGSSQFASIASALSAVVPRGGTPTEDAYAYALNSQLLPTGSVHPGAPVVILVTDGSPTIALGCSGAGQSAQPVDTQPIIQAISDVWTNYSIPTLVIGLPGSESSSYTGPDPRIWMSEAARAGHGPGPGDCNDTGTPRFCHVDLTDVDDLQSSLVTTLESIIAVTDLIPCDYKILPTTAGQVVDPHRVTVAYRQAGANGGQSIPCVIGESKPDCSQGDGWYWGSDSETINLCPQTCSAIHDPPANLELLAGCQTGPIIN